MGCEEEADLRPVGVDEVTAGMSEMWVRDAVEKGTGGKVG
jgi:hypothetical protein